MLGRFIRAYFRNWVVGMTGGASLLFASVLAGLSALGYPLTDHWVYVVIAIGCFVVASFFVWKGEAERADKMVADRDVSEASLRAEVESLKKQVADLVAERDRKPVNTNDIVERAREFRRAGQRLLDADAHAKAYKGWHNRVVQFIKAALNETLASEIERKWTQGSPATTPQQRMASCMDWLNGLTKQLVEDHKTSRFTDAMLREHPADGQLPTTHR